MTSQHKIPDGLAKIYWLSFFNTAIGIGLICFDWDSIGWPLAMLGFSGLFYCYHHKVPIETPQYSLKQLSEQTGYSLEAFVFVHDTLRAIYHGAYVVEGDSIPHIHGKDLCLKFCKRANELFGGRAAEQVYGWGIRDSRDVGKIVYAMVEAGFIHQQGTESIDDFDNLVEFKRQLGLP